MSEVTVSDEIEARAWRALEGVHDPEIPAISVVDLGVIRKVDVGPSTITILVTPTYSGCPAVELIEHDVQVAVQRVVGDDSRQVRVERVLEPAWSTDWITARGRERLRSAGIAPPSSPLASGGGHLSGSRAPKRTFAVLGSSGTAAESDQVACPRCGSLDTTLISEFGSTACKAIWRCNACREPFDQFKSI